MPNSKQIVYLSQTQYQELITNGTITVDGVTVTYDENDIYVTPQAEPVTDVRVNGTSITSGGVANVPVGRGRLGVVLVGSGTAGVLLTTANNELVISRATAEIKPGVNNYKPIVPGEQHQSAFYGLAKAAGSDEKNSTLPVGQYTESAKSAISEMLNGSVTVSGTTPTITALPGIRYVCGEVATLDITLPASGIVDVVFQSGSTATVLNAAPVGGNSSDVKWANGWDGVCEANTTYEINVMDGVYGVVGSWT